MTVLSRRKFALGAAAMTTMGGALAGCANGIGGRGSSSIDARADSALNFLYSRYPGTSDLAAKATGMLVMPVVTEAGFGIGASYGQGVLRVRETSVDYYSAASASAGFQIGAQQYSHVLFFMTEDALIDFRRSSGWAAGADLEYAISETGDMLRAATTTSLAPVVAVVFGQAGLRIGATLEGTKYTRIIP